MIVSTSLHEGLVPVAGYPFAVMASAGYEERARAMATRCERAHRYLGGVFEFSPPFGLLALAEGDWEGRASYPVFGMPHYVLGNLIVAAHDNEMWRGIAAMVGEQPEVRELLREVYPDGAGGIDLGAFFDLLVVHELAHIFHGAVPCHFPRMWVMEVFVNLCLHAYVVNAEPDLLPQLETMPALLAGVPREMVQYTSLADVEALYAGVGALNYGWYQGRWHVAAKRIYESGGVAALRRMWDEFVLFDDQLAGRLEHIDPEAARVLREWPG